MKRISPFLYWMMWGFSWLLFRVFFRMRVVGKENLPSHGAALLAPTHRSYIDIFAVAVLTHRPVKSLGKSELFTGVGKFVLPLLGSYPVRRGEPDRGALRAVAEWFENGELVVVFPEGTRKDGPKIHELHAGVGYLAAKHNVPVIPIAIAGTEDALPRHRKRIVRTQIVAKIGKPVISKSEATSNRVKGRALIDGLRGELQELLDDAHRERITA